MTLKLVKDEQSRFPALKGASAPELTQSFFAERLQQVTVMLVTTATSDASVGKLLRRSIRNWLTDKARATGTGPLRRSIEKVLSEDDLFERVPAGEVGAGRWRISGSGGWPWSGEPAVLVDTAWKVPGVRVPKWSSESRRPPVTDRSSMVSILRAVLEAAGGSLETAQFVYVLSQRFAAALDPIEVPLADEAGAAELAASEPTGEDLVIAAETELEVGFAAAQIVGRLSGEERAIVSNLNDIGAVQERLSRGRSQVYQLISRTKQKIRDLAGTGPEAEQVALEVIRLCRC
ncbi:hypothetical protein ABZW96_35915 [Nocardia sp. NPDC004168]|uniref:hypothetical protein n=1 Tax=Nocardia sp. NPDC004168 TaxID=3154452 RepID=UPI0033B71AC0